VCLTLVSRVAGVDGGRHGVLGRVVERLNPESTPLNPQPPTSPMGGVETDREDWLPKAVTLRRDGIWEADK